MTDLLTDHRAAAGDAHETGPGRLFSRSGASPTAAQLDPHRRTFPVAEPAVVWRHTKTVLGHHRRELSAVLVLHALAAVAALVLPCSSAAWSMRWSPARRPTAWIGWWVCCW